MNQKGEVTTLTKVHVLDTCSDSGGTVYCKHRFIATFSEPLELERFPFNRQLLCIKLTSELFGNRCRLQVAKNCHWKCADINRDAWEAEWNFVQVQNSAPTSGDHNPATNSSTFRGIIAVERKNHVLYDQCGVVARSCCVHFSCVRMGDIGLLPRPVALSGVVPHGYVGMEIPGE